MLQGIVHYGLHFGSPLLIAVIFFKNYWLKAYGIMILGDVDRFRSPISKSNFRS